MRLCKVHLRIVISSCCVVLQFIPTIHAFSPTITTRRSSTSTITCTNIIGKHQGFISFIEHARPNNNNNIPPFSKSDISCKPKKRSHLQLGLSSPTVEEIDTNNKAYESNISIDNKMIPVPVLGEEEKSTPTTKRTTATTTRTAKTTTLTKEQEQFLSSLDVQLHGHALINKIHDLLEYKNIHGSCSVPKRYKNNPALGNWVNKTRQMYRKYKENKASSMTPERIQLLDQIGFIWSGAKVTHFQEFQHSNDHDNINKYSNGNDIILNRNVHDQNQKEGKGQPMIYYNYNNQNSHSDQLWMYQYHKLLEYCNQQKKNENNNDHTPSLTHTKLGAWVGRQRIEYQKHVLGEKSTMSKERIKLLEEIGFDWSPRATNWNLRVRELKEYKKQNGNCLVPIQYDKNPKLGRWVSTQRKFYKQYQNGDTARITKERIKQLDDIGFAWNRWESNWSDC